ncbi:glycosyltransferase WbsX family protein [Mucilaginibacter sp. HD30]
MNTIKAIAINLPQFHPIPENNEWWGRGFTEWTNVVKARPQFKGHYQPHLPADLGFYDLRLEESRIAQANLAKQYGIHGFCYYHYWFNGKRLLNEPIDGILRSGKPDFPFMVCWANENWTRRWDGHDKEILIEQHYGRQDDLDHIRFLTAHFFSDERYIRVNGKPFIIIYRPALLPNIAQTLQTWREYAAKQGMELHIGCMQTYDYKKEDAVLFDCVIDFQPHLFNMPVDVLMPLKQRIKKRLGFGRSVYHNNRIFDYSAYVDAIIKENAEMLENVYPGITPGWDNSARRKKDALIITGSTPREYGRWLEHIVAKYKQKDTFLFINAWNEWAEGNHLEPDSHWGLQYLEQSAKFLRDA